MIKLECQTGWETFPQKEECGWLILYNFVSIYFKSINHLIILFSLLMCLNLHLFLFFILIGFSRFVSIISSTIRYADHILIFWSSLYLEFIICFTKCTLSHLISESYQSYNIFPCIPYLSSISHSKYFKLTIIPL